MGTRMGLVALAWGRDASAFDLRDARRSADGATIALELAPRWSRDRQVFRLDAGAMFERTSWAYVHDLRVGSSELTVDAATRRIVREVDRDARGRVICEVDLGEWVDAGEGRSVPGRVRLRFPGQSFSVDDRFDWHPEGLWILRSGESRFDGREPERESVEGLAIDAPTPELDESLDRAARGVAALDAPAPAPPEPRHLVAGTFAVGKRIPLAGGLLEALAFTFPDVRDDDRPMIHWDHPDLRAVLTRPPGGEAPGSVLLVLYDEGGGPSGRRPRPSRPTGPRWSWTWGGPGARGRPVLVADGLRGGRPAADRPRGGPAGPGRRIVPGKTGDGSGRAGGRGGRPSRGVGQGRDADPRPPAGRRRPGVPGCRGGTRRPGPLEGHPGEGHARAARREGHTIAAASLDHEFRVEGEIHDAPGLAVPLRGPATGAGDLRVVVGLRTMVVGAPMGSTWGRFLDGSSPYPVELLLAGDEPAAWRRGLAALDYEMGMTRALRRGDDPGFAVIDEAAWGEIHRIVRPHGGRLAGLFPGAGGRPARAGPALPAGRLLGRQSAGRAVTPAPRRPRRGGARRGRGRSRSAWP